MCAQSADSVTERTDDHRPPRSVVTLAAISLTLATGVALWTLPDGRAGGNIAGSRSPAGPSASGRAAEGAPKPVSRPRGFLAFVGSPAKPAYNLAGAARPTGARWSTIGYVTASSADGCTPRWVGSTDPGRGPGHGSPGGDVGLVFGGPRTRDLAVTCTDTAQLTAAFQRIIGAFKVRHVEFELRGTGASSGPAHRRAQAIAAVQREAARAGGSLDVTFAFHARRAGLLPRDRQALRTTREAGAEVSTVNLLVPARTRPGQVIGSARAAFKQVGMASWKNIALTPDLAATGDLTVPAAKRYAAFAARRGLAWVTTRGAPPTPAAAVALARP